MSEARRGVAGGSGLVDPLGIVVSGACAAHCLIVSLLPGTLALAGVTAVSNGFLEWGISLGAMGIALWAGLRGLRRHNNRAIFLSLTCGSVVLLGARLAESHLQPWLGLTLSLLAALALVGAHVANAQVLGHGRGVRSWRP